MDTQSLTNVLSLLRLIKASPSNFSGLQLVERLVGEQRPPTWLVLRVCTHLTTQVENAATAMANSSLSEEAKSGVIASLTSLQRSFSIAGMQTSISTFVKDIDQALSNFVLLLEVTGISTKNVQPKEATDFAKEVDALREEMAKAGLDPVVGELASRHLEALATLLRHIPIFGLEAALATYFELIVRLRRANTSADETKKAKAEPFFDRLNKFKERFDTIDAIVSKGAKWVGKAKGAAALLTFFGGSS